MPTPAALLSLAVATRVTLKMSLLTSHINDVHMYISNTDGQIAVEPTKDCW